MARDHIEQELRREDRRVLRQERAAPEAEKKERTRRRRASARPVAPEHVVFLVPGLLGFERFSRFGYFADRVVAALRAGLEQSLDQPVPVIPMPIPPTASLRIRQRTLVKTLADRLHALEHVFQPLEVHLVGHSTGGVDINLLCAEQPIGGGSWNDVDPRALSLRTRIRSVVSIASPHQGACITRDPVARIKSHRDPRGLPALARLVGKFALSAAHDVEIADFLSSAYREAGRAYRFVSDVLSDWDLIGDLQPSRPPSRVALGREVVRRSFVTVAGSRTAGATSSPPADVFFRELAARAAGWTTGCAEEGDLVQASVTRIKQALSSEGGDNLVIKAHGVELPTAFDAGHNDGVVNTARQLADPTDREELAGIVVGDHFDVVGYYDRHEWTADEEGRERPRQVLAGLLHSGSSFRDRQFFELYRRVAHEIAAAAR